ncbi:MAG: hypothetical protein LQ351_001176 [Letrouitia transgressa]|nr:MAG: hypothetical protein LQ351_001176 [Letrouitia transgressa]
MAERTQSKPSPLRATLCREEAQLTSGPEFLRVGDLDATVKSIVEGANEVLEKEDVDTDEIERLYKKLKRTVNTM